MPEPTIRNPFFNPFAGRLTVGQRQQIKADLIALFQANTDRAAIPVSELRAAITVPLGDAAWQIVLARLDDVLG